MTRAQFDTRDAAPGREPAAGRHHLAYPIGKPDTARDAYFWSARHVVITAALWLLGVAALALLAVNAHHYAEFPGDRGIATFIQQFRTTPVAPLINFASDANWPRPAGIIAIVVVVLLALARRIRAAICTAVAAFGADAINVQLNGLVARPRPAGGQIHAVANLGLHSFPSGHVTHVMAFYGFLLYLTILGDRIHPRWRPFLWLVRAVCLYFILFIGVSRVLEGEHWPSDVLASYLLGALVLVVAVALYHVLALAAVHLRDRRAARAATAR